MLNGHDEWFDDDHPSSRWIQVLLQLQGQTDPSSRRVLPQTQLQQAQVPQAFPL